MAQRDEWLKAADRARPLIFEYENPALLRGDTKGASAYRDEGGWTIGFGVRTRAGEELNTKQAFHKYAKSEASKVDFIVSELGPDGDKGLTLDQKAQIFSFVHNVTPRSGARALHALKDDGFAAAQKVMSGVVRGTASRKQLPGLVARRKDEELLGKGLYSRDTTRGPSLAGLQDLYSRFMKGIDETAKDIGRIAGAAKAGIEHTGDTIKTAAVDVAKKSARDQQMPVEASTAPKTASRTTKVDLAARRARRPHYAEMQEKPQTHRRQRTHIAARREHSRHAQASARSIHGLGERFGVRHAETAHRRYASRSQQAAQKIYSNDVMNPNYGTPAAPQASHHGRYHHKQPSRWAGLNTAPTYN